MPDGPEKDAALAHAKLGAERKRIEAMPDGLEKEELIRTESMPDGPEKDAAFARAKLDAERKRIEVMPDGPEKEAALVALRVKEEEMKRI